MVAASRDPKFGDYQCNAAMPAAKKLGRKPRELAEELIAAVKPGLEESVESLEVAGPGFINVRLRDEWLSAQLDAMDVARWPHPSKRVVVDYSSPNVAKEMHVGHLRSTIIGDAICRILAFAGHDVVRQNHVGDWGTQFGMLCAYLKEHGGELEGLSGIEELYRRANALYKEDPEFAARARAEVVNLHGGEPSTLEAWRRVLDRSREHYLPIYRRLGVLLTEEDERGESFYNDRLAEVVEDLATRFAPGRATPLEVRESEGALCAFLQDEAGKPMFEKDDQPTPFIIRKSDGAFLYASTDLAALRFRVAELGGEHLIYVVGIPQTLHFQMLFATARAAGLTRLPDGREATLEHVAFGSVLGADRKPLKTREGGTVKLMELLDEAVERAERVVREKSEGFSDEEIRAIAEAVGIGAVKYADLSQSRTTDYVFSFDKMVSMQGNTAPYLMYAYARIRSIVRQGEDSQAGAISLGHPTERALATTLLQFPELLETVMSGWKINLLADYLYGVAGAFNRFYENCRVLDDEEHRASRLALCQRTAEVLERGLGLLGIRVLERM